MRKHRNNLKEGILFTDFYQLTMAQVYFATGLYKKEAQFDYFFRSYPNYDTHSAGYCVNAGLEWLISWMQNARFGQAEIGYLRNEKGRAGKRLFRDDFLKWLKDNGDFSRLSLEAIPEGRVVHPQVPIAVVRGPFIQAQLLESSLLNHLNYQTLIATKASRVFEAGNRNLIIEFGMRRAQGRGANEGARAALIGGAAFTSNTGISYDLGFPPKGTHAHSMVQAFIAQGETELGAFRAYAQLYPDDCIFLVDTVDTLNSGIPNAIKVFEELKKRGHKPVGIRLDSGDLAFLSIKAARMLNDAGFEDVSIVLSNQIDELVIWQIISQIRKDAPKEGLDPDHLINRLVYGVGTRLITSKGDAALDGVYKLAAVKDANKWMPAIKISETPSKVINPGNKSVFRIYDKRDKAVADLLTLKDEEIFEKDEITLHHPVEHDTKRVLKKGEISQTEPLLKDILVNGKLVYNFPSIEDIRKIREQDLERLDSGVKRLINPHTYHVSLSSKLWNLKLKLIKSYNHHT